MGMVGKRKVSGNYENNIKKLRRKKYIAIRPFLELNDYKCKLLRMWTGNHDITENGIQIRTLPFKYCQVKAFFNDEEFIDDLRSEMCNLEFTKKNNDLYQFRQSLDFSNIDTPSVNMLKSFLAGSCKSWLQMITGIELSGKISVTCSSYSHTDYLLCHDDRCEDRRIAFIIYLNKNWTESDGGALQLFDRDDSSQPKDVVTSLLPEFNSFVFFEVTNNSFHQVAEVLTMDKTRMTVNGWFHGSCDSIVPRHDYMASAVALTKSAVENGNCGTVLHNVDLDTFHLFLNPVYLDSENQKHISKVFETESEILLPNFMNKELYCQICKSLRRDSMKWEKKGPANYRSYFVAVEDTLDPSIKALLSFMSSNEMFQFLHKLTNLDLQSSDPDNEKDEGNCSQDDERIPPRCTYEMQKWENGCYTLLSDNDIALKENGLDATLYFNVNDIQEHQGGFTSYIALDSDEELLKVTPTCNALALTYRDKETLRFVKYINHSLTESFQAVSFIYYE